MTMESPVVQTGAQGISRPAPGSTNGSPTEQLHTLQPLTSVQSTVDSTQTGIVSQQAVTMAMAQIPVSMQSAFVMAQGAVNQSTAGQQNAQLLMQPPASVPLMVPPYQMILPTQGVIDQQALLQQQAENSSRASTPSSPSLAGRVSRSGTPVMMYQQAQTKTESVPSPARQGSTGSAGSPAPPTPGSLGSPLPQIMADGTIAAQPGLQLQGIQSSHLPVNLQIGINPQTGAAQRDGKLNMSKLKPPNMQFTKTMGEESSEESVDSNCITCTSVDISKLKPPKKPLTSYMRFSKMIWPQVKAANSNMTVCEIGSTIGRMWRDLDDTEKQKYNEEFANDKLRYDVDIAEYLKITGLQASDLVKKPKKKANTDSKSRNRSHAKAPQPAAQVEQQVVQQVAGQQVIGVQPIQLGTNINGPVSVQNSPGATAMPQQVQISNLSGLPTFSQVWQNQQGGATLFSQAQAGQEQLIVQQGPGGQQIVVNALGMPTGTVVNGSTGASGENVLTAPILIQPADGQTLFSTDADGHVVKEEGDGTATSQATMTQLATLGWQQVVPGNAGDVQQQQMINLINMAAAQSGVQPDQLTQAAQIAGLQPPGVPINLQQVNIEATTADSTTESQSMEVVSSEASQSDAQTVQNGTTAGGTPTQSVVTVAQMPTAHSLYNSYGFNPWSAISGQVVQTAEVVQQDGTAQAADGTTQGGIQVVYNRENILETELLHLRSALSEKTREVQRLSQELEKAYSIIEQLKQQNPTAVIQLPAPLPTQVATESPAPPATPPATTVTTTT